MSRIVDVLDNYLDFSDQDHQLLSGLFGDLHSSTISYQSASGTRGGVAHLYTGSLDLDPAVGLRLWNGLGDPSVHLKPTGDAFFGYNIDDPSKTSLMILSVSQYYNSEFFGQGDLLIGDNSAGKANLFWDRSAGRLNFRGGTTTYVYIDTDGSIVAQLGVIGGWIIDATTIHDSSSTIVLDSANEKITVATNKVVLNTSGITAIAGVIGGWNITATTLHDDNSKIILDSANEKIDVGTTIDIDGANQKITVGAGISLEGANQLIRVGASSPQIEIDGANKEINSTNWASGVSGFWMGATYGDAEFNNVRIRGAIRASVFEYGDIQATAGSLVVSKSAAKLKFDWTSPASLESSNTMGVDNDLQGTPLFAVGDILRLKHFTATGVAQAWVEVTGVSDQGVWTNYTVKLKSGDTSTLFRAGIGIADYGQSGDGVIYLSADGVIGSSANMSITDHTGSPWTSETLRVRLGNLNGSFGVSADDYGIGLGDYSTGHWLRYTKNLGFKIASVGGKWWVDSSGMHLQDDSVNVLVQLLSYGISKFGADLAAGASGTSMVIVGPAQSWNGEAFGAGDVLFGDNTTAKANMLWDRSEGQLKFRGGTNVQLYIDTDGSLVAGGGHITLNATGQMFTSQSSETYSTSIRWLSGSVSTTKLTGYLTASLAYTQLSAYGSSGLGRDSKLELLSNAADNSYAQTKITSLSSGVTPYVAAYYMQFINGPESEHVITGPGLRVGGNAIPTEDMAQGSIHAYADTNVPNLTEQMLFKMVSGATANKMSGILLHHSTTLSPRVRIRFTADSGDLFHLDAMNTHVYFSNDSAGGAVYFQCHDSTGLKIVWRYWATSGYRYARLGDGTGAPAFQIDGAAGQYRFLEFLSGTSLRWRLDVGNVAESGSNVGSDFRIFNYNDSGGYLGQPLRIERSTGYAYWEKFVQVGAAFRVCGTSIPSTGAGAEIHYGAGIAYFQSYNRSTSLYTPLRIRGNAVYIDEGSTNRLTIDGADVYTIGWTDWSSSSNIVGFSSYTQKLIYYKKIGKLVWVQFMISGTGSGTATSFSTPYTQQTNMGFQIPVRIRNNGAWNIGLLSMNASSSTVNFYINYNGDAWTDGGTRTIYGQFWFQATL